MGGPPMGPPPFNPNPPSGTSTTTILLIVGGIIAVLGLGTCGLCVGIGAWGGSTTSKRPATSNSKVTVYVYCEGSPANGFNCSVTHTGGNQVANACWDINVTCDNTRVYGHACQSVSPGGKTTRFVGPGELRNAYVCNRNISTSVDNVTVTTP